MKKAIVFLFALTACASNPAPRSSADVPITAGDCTTCEMKLSEIVTPATVKQRKGECRINLVLMTTSRKGFADLKAAETRLQPLIEDKVRTLAMSNAEFMNQKQAVKQMISSEVGREVATARPVDVAFESLACSRVQ